MCGAAYSFMRDDLERAVLYALPLLGALPVCYPLSGASRFRGSGHDIDVYAFGREEAPLVAEVKVGNNGAEFTAADYASELHEQRFPGMYLLKRTDGSPSDMVNWTRARDALAE